MKNGFSLVELLAVIAILSIILLIVTPIINGTLKNSKEKVNMNSTYSLIRTADLYYSEDTFGDIKYESNIIDKLNYSGRKPDSGFVAIDEDGNVAVGVIFDKMCYSKEYNSDKVIKSSDLSLCDDSNINTNLKLTIKDKLIQDDKNNTFIKVGDDYRYRGANVNNYVTFSKQSFRIIGYINGYIKLIKNDTIGEYKWSDNNVNDWSKATLQVYFNESFYNSLSDKDMIQTISYNLGGKDNNDSTVDEIYAMENGTKVYSGRPTKIDNTKIAIMYGSDYGYSMSSECNSTPYGYQFDNNCKENGTWLYNNGLDEWLLNPASLWGDVVYHIGTRGQLDINASANSSHHVRPVLFLKSDVKISSGEGTISKPYILHYE